MLFLKNNLQNLIYLLAIFQTSYTKIILKDDYDYANDDLSRRNYDQYIDYDQFTTDFKNDDNSDIVDLEERGTSDHSCSIQQKMVLKEGTYSLKLTDISTAQCNERKCRTHECKLERNQYILAKRLPDYILDIIQRHDPYMPRTIYSLEDAQYNATCTCK